MDLCMEAIFMWLLYQSYQNFEHVTVLIFRTIHSLLKTRTIYTLNVLMYLFIKKNTSLYGIQIFCCGMKSLHGSRTVELLKKKYI